MNYALFIFSVVCIHTCAGTRTRENYSTSTTLLDINFNHNLHSPNSTIKNKHVSHPQLDVDLKAIRFFCDAFHFTNVYSSENSLVTLTQLNLLPDPSKHMKASKKLNMEPTAGIPTAADGGPGGELGNLGALLPNACQTQTAQSNQNNDANNTAHLDIILLPDPLEHFKQETTGKNLNSSSNISFGSYKTTLEQIVCMINVVIGCILFLFRTSIILQIQHKKNIYMSYTPLQISKAIQPNYFQKITLLLVFLYNFSLTQVHAQDNAILCIRESPETCRGSPTKLVDVSDEPSWGLKPNGVSLWQASYGGNGIALSAFGDTDGDGDVDMVALVCTQPSANSYCNADLKFFENVAGAVPGTPPLWQVRASNYAKGDISAIIPPGFTYYDISYPGYHVMHGGFITLVDQDQDGDLDIVLQTDNDNYYTNLEGNAACKFFFSANTTFCFSFFFSSRGFTHSFSPTIFSLIQSERQKLNYTKMLVIPQELFGNH